jgi:uncharacterized membrane protein YqaE (UPF0057 family)
MFKILTAILIPPLSIFLEFGVGKKFFINVVLTICGIVPGVIHAIWNLSEEKRGFALDRLMGKS